MTAYNFALASYSFQVTFFSRSGFIRSPGRSTLFWLGDQLVTWDGFDGLASVRLEW